jgi:hypothetical protein
MVRTGRIEDTVNEIRTMDWDALLPSLQTNFNNHDQGQLAFDTFYSAILAAEDVHQPKKVAKIKNDKPWMTQYIKKMINERQRLFYAGPEHQERWKQLCKTIKSAIKKRKRAFNSKYTTGDINYWKEVKAIDKPNTKIETTLEQAEEINNGFYSVWGGKTQPDLTPFIIEGKSDAKQIFNFGNVGEALRKLKPSAPGPDEITPKLLKTLNLEIVALITALFNLCLINSFVPFQWKSANITPIPKVQIPTNPLDYRPISLTSSLCKVFERILAKFILKQTESLWKNNSQYGFLPKRSTMDAIVQVIEDWSEAKDTKKEILAIFFDFAKAFDLVDHVKLLEKLLKYLPRWLVSWIAAYLQGRRQRVVMGTKTTEWKQVEAGVVQGSVLGPILFILFIYDINDYIPVGVNVLKYADDILAYITGSGVSGTLPDGVAKGVSEWCEVNGMRLNTSKCKVMRLGSANKSQTQQQPIKLNGEPLEEVSSYKYLGVEINDQMEWDHQWSCIQRKVKSLPYLLKRLKTLGFKEGILATVYRSHGLSHFNYSAPLLTACTSKTKSEIANFHKRALRIIDITPGQAKKQYNICEIDELIDAQCTKLLKRILADAEHPLTAKIPRVTGTAKFKFKIAKARTVAYGKSFVQKYLKTIRDGVTGLYTTATISTAAVKIAPSRQLPLPAQVPVTEQTVNCPICQKSCKPGRGLDTHHRMMHKPKQTD